MSMICQNFVQNAWKKELCSNCFKSKDEHTVIKKSINSSKERVESIIKRSTKLRAKHTVSFTNELAQVIGYGGDDWSDVEEENSFDEDALSDESSDVDGDEDKELRRLTKANTDFNTINSNLASDDALVKKSFTHLKLGTPQIDSEGKKQTLMVTVTPFGQESICKKITKASSHIPVAKNNKEIALDNKNTAVLTSYVSKSEDIFEEEKSLLEEISETLEKSKSPIQIISRKRTQKDVVLAVTKFENFKSSKDNDKPIIKCSSTYLLEKAAEKSTEKIKDLKANKSSIPERKTVLTRSTVIKKDQEKPALFQTSTAQIELVTSKFKAKNETVKTNDLKDEVPSTENSLTESLGAPESREQAGEPDGHADPDGSNEPPALPTTPPPNVESRTSFLHGSPCEKPKVPSKPITVAIRKEQCLVSETEAPIDYQKKKLDKQDSNGSDVGRGPNKRRAPKPPVIEEPSPVIYSRNFNFNINIDSPVLREKEKRERASSCSPKAADDIDTSPDITSRKLLSLSTDSLLGAGLETKKKEKHKTRFSLKKFLRMSSSKDSTEAPKYEEVKFGGDPHFKPKLVIVHPLDLYGGKVEVLSKPEQLQMLTNEQSLKNKPLPPPRHFEDCNKLNKPNLPHPPKSAEVLNKQKSFANMPRAYKLRNDSLYANIGEVRSAITPNKPQRTASMREREALIAQQQKPNFSDNYEPIQAPNKEHVYDYINNNKSNPSEVLKFQRSLNQSRSNSNVDVSGDYYKFQNIPRSASLTYCGSETESEIYSPCSFYGSESEVADDDNEWTHNGRTYKLRSRKGRSIVHKNLEDNYGAVVVANHEALAQVLENIQQGSQMQPALRGLKFSPHLRWNEFSIKENLLPLVIGNRVFHQAVWGAHHVTVVVSAGTIPIGTLSMGTFNLIPITEFTDLISSKYLPRTSENNEEKLVQASVAVLPWIQVNTIYTYTDLLRSKLGTNSQEELYKDACFILLQLINALKMLQAQGIEELPLSLTSFMIYKEMDKDCHHRLCILQGLGEDMTQQKDDVEFGSLCQCASKVLMQLLPQGKLTPLLRSLLNTERAVCLTQVKSVLEFFLWGPSDVALSMLIRERELALQRWLDLQRATVLHGLVCTRIQLTIYEECHLLFLVRSNSKMMCDASLLLDSINKQSHE